MAIPANSLKLMVLLLNHRQEIFLKHIWSTDFTMKHWLELQDQIISSCVWGGLLTIEYNQYRKRTKLARNYDKDRYTYLCNVCS